MEFYLILAPIHSQDYPILQHTRRFVSENLPSPLTDADGEEFPNQLAQPYQPKMNFPFKSSTQMLWASGQAGIGGNGPRYCLLSKGEGLKLHLAFSNTTFLAGQRWGSELSTGSFQMVNRRAGVLGQCLLRCVAGLEFSCLKVVCLARLLSSWSFG